MNVASVFTHKDWKMAAQLMFIERAAAIKYLDVSDSVGFIQTWTERIIKNTEYTTNRLMLMYQCTRANGLFCAKAGASLSRIQV